MELVRLRVLSPTDRTAPVVARFSADAGTAHLTVLPGAAKQPAGDVIVCDVVREAASYVLADLRALGIDQDGAIVVEPVGAAISHFASDALRSAPGAGADAVIWENLDALATNEATPSITFLAFMAIATMIAACGVILDNPILIVGSMVVGPEFGPMCAVAVGLLRRDWRTVRRALWMLLLGFATAIVLTGLFVDVMHGAGVFQEKSLEGPHPNTSFIWRPDAYSFIVAVLAGTAGMLSVTSGRSTMLVGVVISVTTIPAAAAATLYFTDRFFVRSEHAFLQLVLNLTGIMLAGLVTLFVIKLLDLRRRARHRDRYFAPSP
jgi:uncharacterized hydrophobic protein (TIGR00271 family)